MDTESTENVSWITLSNGKTFPRKVYSAYSVDELKEVITCCKNYQDILDVLKINRFYHKYLVKFIDEHKIDISHFKRDTTKTNKTTLKEKLVKGDKHIASKNIKKYLIKNKFVKEECNICHLPPVWNNKPLVLQLDHINGDHFDNRVENLQLICPNCHTQTDTFTGKNLAVYKKKVCSVCTIKVLKSDNITGKCAACITKEKKEGVCIDCKINTRHRSNLKCKDCLKIPREIKKCKGCNREIKRSYNDGDYHRRCFKGITKDGDIIA